MRMKIEIPGYKAFELKYLVLDYNGTIATDGTIPDPVKDRLRQLADELKIYVLTADTHGTARENCEELPLEIRTFPEGSAMDAKHRTVKELGIDSCVAVGNGRNDTLMLRESSLAIAVTDREGMYSGLISEADVCVHKMEDALDLLLYPKRLIATLRG